MHFVTQDRVGNPRIARALNGVDLTLGHGEILGLVGETGAGKSLTSQAVMGLLRSPARLVGGSIRFDGEELTTLDEMSRNRLRGAQMSLVVQSPKTSLDPLSRVGDQLVRIQRAHSKIDHASARKRAIALLEAVGIPEPARRMKAWPFELSGGMAQRVLIAMALANKPKLIIADEPTTGLDVTVQTQILDLLHKLTRDFGTALMMITHDLGVVAQYCDRVAVMFAGSIVECGPVHDVLVAPRHPYTQALLAATPDVLMTGQRAVQAGPPPDLYNLPEGCVYADRCPRADGACAVAPARSGPSPEHAVFCHHHDRMAHV